MQQALDCLLLTSVDKAISFHQVDTWVTAQLFPGFTLPRPSFPHSLTCTVLMVYYSMKITDSLKLYSGRFTRFDGN